MQATSGSLVIVDANTQSPKVFWKGALVPNLLKIFVHNHSDDYDVKLVVSKDDPIYSDMIASGVFIRIKQ